MATPVLLGNLIGAVGVPAQMAGHGVLATRAGRQRLAMTLSAAGAVFTVTGAVLLGSWPIVFLDSAWAGLSMIGAWSRRGHARAPAPQAGRLQAWQRRGLYAVLAGALALAMARCFLAAGFAVATLYLLAYTLYATHWHSPISDESVFPTPTHPCYRRFALH